MGVQKLTRSGLNGASEEGLLKDKFAFFEAYKSPIPKRRALEEGLLKDKFAFFEAYKKSLYLREENCLKKRPFL